MSKIKQEKKDNKKKPSSGGMGGRISTDHIKNAARFMDFVHVMKTTCGIDMKQTLIIPNARDVWLKYLKQHNVKHIYEIGLSSLSGCVLWPQSLLRVNVPMCLQHAINKQFGHDPSIWKAKKIPITWVMCFLNGNTPDRAKNCWETFECSHRCTTDNCIRASHLTWESKSDNQSRGHSKRICLQSCKHQDCGKCLCECAEIHKPCCIQNVVL